MTTYRLFPSASGPATAISYSGNFVAGVAFTVTGGGNWFAGYWWWVATNGGTTPVSCALWSVTGANAGTVVPGSVITSATLTAGQWNYIPLSQPLQLAPGYDPGTSSTGSAYIAAIGVNGNFPDTPSQFNSGDPYSTGITAGPLVAYSGSTGSKPPPFLSGQGLFTVGGSDPSAVMPNQADSAGDGGSNFWVDVAVSDTAPIGYYGSWRLWPNKADANPVIAGDSAVNYTIGTEVHLTAACNLNYAWYYSQPGAVNLATRADVWDTGTGLPVASITAPSWLTATGSAASAGDGWVKAAFAGGTSLAAGAYVVSVYNSNGTAGTWAPKDAATNYWGQGGSGGVAAAGITAGPLHAPPQPGAVSGWAYSAGASGATPPYSSGTAINAQPPFGQLPSGAVDFPQLYAAVGGGSNQSQNYWVDLEVTLVNIAASPGVAAGTGAAQDASVSAGISGSASAGVATGSGTALDATVSAHSTPGAATAHLGGTFSAPNTLGGTGVVAATPSGSLTVTANALGGTADEDTMQEVDITLNSFNDMTVTFTVTSGGSDLDLTATTVNMLLKPARGSADTASGVLKLSSAGGSPAITVTSAVAGACSALIPGTSITPGAFSFYRIDVVTGGKSNTAIFGTVTIIAL